MFLHNKIGSLNNSSKVTWSKIYRWIVFLNSVKDTLCVDLFLGGKLTQCIWHLNKLLFTLTHTEDLK